MFHNRFQPSFLPNGAGDQRTSAAMILVKYYILLSTILGEAPHPVQSMGKPKACPYSIIEDDD